jgi:integrase
MYCLWAVSARVLPVTIAIIATFDDGESLPEDARGRTFDGVGTPRLQPSEHPSTPEPIAALVAEWHQTMVARRMADAGKYQRMVLSVAQSCGWVVLADATVRSLSKWFGDFAPSYASSTTANHLSALVKFFSWAGGMGLIDHNPAKAIEPPAYERGDGSRASTPEEFVRIVAAARHAEATDKRAAKSSRSSLYIVSGYTGLRRLELAKLRVRMFEDGSPAWLNLEARVSKGRKPKAIRIPLHPEAAEELRRLVRGRGPDEPVFIHSFVDWRIFKNDLKRARVPEVDARGKVLTFHGLRKTFATNLARYGVGQRAAQALMRHGDPKMTAILYQDAELLPLAREVAKIPTLTQMAGERPERVIHNLENSLDNASASDQDSSSDTVQIIPIHVDVRNPLAASGHGVATSVVASGFGMSQVWCFPSGVLEKR